ncbi:EIN3-binding F-box protein 1-like isoform X1 [Gossypium australe]|uniref:EIN3-binding F-box protein 1-like isoform X1 n=1 Tax=Gossypium australe TaxID=47621 RepID=A0A5B6W8N3_9ROSI|nr:EIN3-binding F-box protein 1-like isoform X1 [Gossypium australe]
MQTPPYIDFSEQPLQVASSFFLQYLVSIIRDDLLLLFEPENGRRFLHGSISLRWFQSVVLQAFHGLWPWQQYIVCHDNSSLVLLVSSALKLPTVTSQNHQIVGNGNEADIVTLPRDHRIKISYSQQQC